MQTKFLFYKWKISLFYAILYSPLINTSQFIQIMVWNFNFLNECHNHQNNYCSSRNFFWNVQCSLTSLIVMHENLFCNIKIILKMQIFISSYFYFKLVNWLNYTFCTAEFTFLRPKKCYTLFRAYIQFFILGL